MNLAFGAYVIRSWRPGDEAPVQRYADNRKIWINLRDAFPHPYTLEDARDWIAFASGRDPEWAFAIATPEEAIGGIGLDPGSDVHRGSAELGYWLGEPFWGRGIATAAVRALSAWAFAHRPIHRIHAGPFARNQASVRVLEKAGYRREGLLRRSVIKDGRLEDQVVLALLEEEACGPGAAAEDEQP